MGQRILQLYQLQALDSETDQIKRQLSDVLTQLGESDALKQAKATQSAAESRFRKTHATMQDLDLEVKSISEKISGQEKLLYSGRVLNAKEAANLQDEVASLKRWHTDREEHLLEAMVDFEEAEESLSAAQDDLTGVEAEWVSGQGDLVKNRDSLARKLSELKTRRPTVSAPISQADLAVYEKLRPKKAGRAVSVVKNKVCQGCGMTPSNSKLQRARSDEELMYCTVCGRILYVP